MSKLLSAGFYRLFRHRIFWLELAVTFVSSLGICFSNYSPELALLGYTLRLEDIFFTFYLLIGLFCAASISLILGSEYSDGALRNKLTVGHGRVSIYLSALTVCTVASWAMLLTHLLVTSTVGYSLFGAFETLGVKQAVFAVFTVSLATAAYSAICVAIAMNCQHKVYSAVGCVLLAILLMYAANYLGSALAQPEKIEVYLGQSSASGEAVRLIPNPDYVRGIQRKVFTFYYALLPDAQVNVIHSLDFSCNEPWAYYSIGLYTVASAIGAFLFCKKDIR